jgi:hypothetical protein
MPQDHKAGTGLALIEGFVRQVGGTTAWEVEGGTRLTVKSAFARCQARC